MFSKIMTKIIICVDSSLYAHYVFKSFDINCNGAISFRVRIQLDHTVFEKFLAIFFFQIRPFEKMLH